MKLFLLFFVSVLGYSANAIPPLRAVADNEAGTTIRSEVVAEEIPDFVSILEKEIIANDDSSIPVTTDRPDVFPTPKPFLTEPISGVIPETYPEIPPLDLKLFPHISINTENKISYYTGRSPCECGRKGIRLLPEPNLQKPKDLNDTKIVNGEPARIEEYPWTVGLLRKSWLGTVSKTPYCGVECTLINNLYVVTASHCVDGMSAGGIVVALHEEDFASGSELNEETIKVSVHRIIMHPRYNRKNIDNDIALLRLSQSIELGKVFVPACLPANNDHSFEKEIATVCGWGAQNEGGGVSTALRKVDVPIISNDDCNSTQTKYEGKITENMLCAGNIEEGGKDSCQGDSGGPLIIENGGRRTLVGVVSWGYGCARPKSPGVYTRTGQYSEWILANTPSADWCSG